MKNVTGINERLLQVGGTGDKLAIFQSLQSQLPRAGELKSKAIDAARQKGAATVAETQAIKGEAPLTAGERAKTGGFDVTPRDKFVDVSDDDKILLGFSPDDVIQRNEATGKIEVIQSVAQRAASAPETFGKPLNAATYRGATCLLTLLGCWNAPWALASSKSGGLSKH